MACCASLCEKALVHSKLCVPFMYAVDEWQVIEIGGTGITTVQDASSSPRTRACNRWRNAIKQQILLNRMEKENQLFNSELTL